MGKILENFVPTTFTIVSKTPYSLKSFRSGILHYSIFSFVFFGISWIYDFDKRTTDFWLSCLVPLLVIVFLNIVGYFLFKNDNFKKYAVLIAYFSGLAYSFFILAFLVGFTRNPKFTFHYHLNIVLGVWLVWLGFHFLLLWISQKKDSLKIRDKYEDYYFYGASFISILIMSFAEDNFSFFLMGVDLLVGMGAILLTYHIPRILPYWTGEFKEMEEDNELGVDGPMAYMEEMEDFELEFKNIKIKDVTKILTAFKFKSENVKMSDFLIDGKNKEYKDIISFSQYFKKPGECRLLVEDLNIGFNLKEALIIISFGETYSSFEVWFSKEDWEESPISDDDKKVKLLNNINEIKSGICYSSIKFSNYSGDDGYELLFHMDN